MFITAEIRWFWKKEPAAGFKDWFMDSGSHGCSPKGGAVRTDEYLNNQGETELGIKIRGGYEGIDIKGLVEIKQNGLSVEPFTGPVEIWAKWRSGYIELKRENTIPVEKERWMRLFETGTALPVEIEEEVKQLHDRGCGVELTRVVVRSETWWTFGFESFGTLETVEGDLRSVTTILASRNPPGLGNAMRHSYPSWLDSNCLDNEP
jgi:hypothetical protein